jgi:gliding motility-associated-like protein
LGGNGTFNYQWESSTDNINWNVITGVTTEDYTPPPLTVTTYYRRKVTSGICSGYSSTVTITVNPLPNAAISAIAATICQYDAGSVSFNSSAGTGPFNLQLTVTAPGGFSNTINQTGIASGPVTINVLPANSAANNYTVTITSLTDSKGCVRTTGMSPVTITVNPKPVVTVPTPADICEATTGAQLNATSNVTGTTYVWSPASGLSATTGASVTATPASTSTYNVTGTAAGCISDATPVTVTVNPKPTAPAGSGPFTVCQNTSAPVMTATATGSNTLTWYDNAALTNGTSSAPPVPVNTAGTLNYYVTQTSAAGCISSPTIIAVTVQPSISNNTIGADQTLCAGTAAAALSQVGSLSGGAGTYNYQWDQSTDGGSTWVALSGETSSGLNPGVLPVTSKYRRTVTSGTCSNTSNIITITIQSPISNTAIDGDRTICEGSAPALLTGPVAAGGGGTFSYQWESSPDNSTWVNAPGVSTNKNYQPPSLTATTWYRRKVAGGSCSAVSASVKVTVNPLPNGAITAPAPICAYDSAAVNFTASIGAAPFTVDLTITAPGGATSTLTKLVPNSNPYAITVIPANSAAGTYTIALTSIKDNINCPRTTGFTPVTITVNPKPVVTTNTPSSFCQGTTGTSLTASGAGTYTWSPAAGLNATTGNSVLASPASTTTYTVIGTANGCISDPVQVTVSVDPRPAKPNVLSPVMYCQYDNAQVLVATPDAGNILTWYTTYPSAGQANAPTPNTNTNGTVKYWVTQTSPAGCTSDTNVIIVGVHPAPVVTFTMPAAICMSENGSGIASFASTSNVSDNSSLSYNWNFGDGTYGSGNAPNHFYQLTRPYADQQVILTATSAFNCSASDTNILRATVFHDKPIANFNVTDTVFCQGKTIIFSDQSTGATGIRSWSWNFGDVTNSATRSPAKTFAKPGDYLVQLVVKDSANCTSDVYAKHIIVNLQPVVDAGQSFYVMQGTAIHFNPRVNDSVQVSFAWSPASDFPNANMLRPSIIVTHDQKYTLTATGPGNCMASDTMSVYVLQPVNIPNAFSPNGDGINDRWEIPNLSRYPGCSVEVFNRYGQKVFSSAGYGTPWDGKYNGQSLPVATYYYVIIFKNGFAPVSGSITIIK